MNKCGCYHEIPDSTSGNCWGTKERDECSCRGDQTKCDFYPEVREKAREKHHVVYERESPTIDIHKIIDEAMEKKDRTVSIFIGDAGMSVNVSPLDADKPTWKPIAGRNNTRTVYSCSACNRPSDQPYAYCPWCGEAVALPSVEEQIKYARASKGAVLDRNKRSNELRRKVVETATMECCDCHKNSKEYPDLKFHIAKYEEGRSGGYICDDCLNEEVERVLNDEN